ncbi:hypothetical protein LNKW23_24870 [Paralimibaculum aggregatum]|uniref:Uncharacterized protein n=1 Tax=Paralimibaculum aggregatum TaxID=3036245 RepID=A0ABQ6LLU2_9RHOB|nr:hypothetical protein [Limibaculum sp. NKW23]GMG83274.1 hypothetical protein LNKW23_24870 [Limibaculum sp. NKW23]
MSPVTLARGLLSPADWHAAHRALAAPAHVTAQAAAPAPARSPALSLVRLVATRVLAFGRASRRAAPASRAAQTKDARR